MESNAPLMAREFTNSEMSEGDKPFTLREWLDNNAECADNDMIASMCSLEVGSSYTTGGGAVAEVTTTRVR